MRESFVHVSFDIVDNFVLRVPKDRAIGAQEDDTTPRICVSTDIHHALLAVPQAGEVIRYMQILNMPLVIHAYYLSSDNVYAPVTSEVPDVEETKERWLLKTPEKVMRRDYELVDPLILKHLCMNGLKKYGIISTGLRPVKFQSNSENLKKALKIPECNFDDFNKAIKRYSFRTVIQVLGKVYEKQHISAVKKGEDVEKRKENGTACITA